MANQQWQVRYLKESESFFGQQMRMGSQEEMEALFQELKSTPEDTHVAMLYNEKGFRVDAYEHPRTRMS